MYGSTELGLAVPRKTIQFHGSMFNVSNLVRRFEVVPREAKKCKKEKVVTYVFTKKCIVLTPNSTEQVPTSLVPCAVKNGSAGRL
jgi:hypothetical protein